MSKEELKALHAEGRIREVIDGLLEQSEGGYFHNEVVQQSDRWREYEKLARGASSVEESTRVQRNQIGAAVLALIDEVYAAGSNSSKGIGLWGYISRVALLVTLVGGVIASLKHLGFIGDDSSMVTQSITVLVHGAAGKGDIVLPNRGEVTLFHGDEVSTKQINNRGEITFKQIDKAYTNGEATVSFSFIDPEGEPYQLRYPDSSYHIQAGESTLLEVILEGMDQLEGTVKDFVTGEPLDSVHIRIRGNSYYTNAFGEFILDIPKDRQSQFIDMRLEKDGYEAKELQNVPTTTGAAQTISLKPLQ